MSLAQDQNTGGVVAAMEARHAAEDARTTARLDWWIKVAGRCYGCQAHVSDEVAAQHPGVCDTCHRRKKLNPISVPAEFTQPPPEPTAVTRLAIVPAQPREEAMPKGVRTEPHPCCGSNGSRHLSSCTGKGKAIDVPVTRKAPAPRQAARRVGRPAGGDLSDLTLDDLLARRVEATETLEAVVEELKRRQEAIREALGSGL